MVRRVTGRCAEDGGEGVRRLARGGRGSRRRQAWDCPSVAGRCRGGAALIFGTEPEREWGKEQKICAKGLSLSDTAKMERRRCAARSRRCVGLMGH